MPYAPEHKAKTRARIVESARILFNRRGFAEVTIDEIMAEAGLTRGGFYKHFATKDELYAESVRSFVSCNPFARRLAAKDVVPEPKALARLLVNLYLSDEVAADPDSHCPLYALPSDVARSGLAPREAYTDVIRMLKRVYRRAFAADDREGGRKAELLVSISVGGMVLARTTNDATLARSLRATARREALAILDRDGSGESRA